MNSLVSTFLFKPYINPVITDITKIIPTNIATFLFYLILLNTLKFILIII